MKIAIAIDTKDFHPSHEHMAAAFKMVRRNLRANLAVLDNRDISYYVAFISDTDVHINFEWGVNVNDSDS